MGLLGYFFSLRPQETVALEKYDFALGLKVLSFEASRTMILAGMDGGLTVVINKQFSKGLGVCSPKSMSAGVVACFNADARVEVQRALEATEGDRLFPLSLDHYYHLWARYGIPGITLKDLRRASIYWLAHYSKLPLAALRNHARHRSIETTGLYTRRPDEEFFQDEPEFYR
jgi:integrase